MEPKNLVVESPYQRILAGREALYFLHVPRTAGTSTTSLLDVHFARDAICPWQTVDRLEDVSPEQWRGFQLYRGHFGIDFKQWIGREPLYMTMLRNPIDSAISAFYDAQRLGALPEGMTLAEFVDSDDAESMGVRFRQHLLRDAEATLRRTSDRESIQMAIDNLEQFTFVGVTEQFDQSMQLLAHTMGWQCPPVAPRRNHTNGRSRHVDDTTRAKVAERVAAEMEIYDAGVRMLAQRHADMCVDLLDREHRARIAARPRVAEVALDLDGPIDGIGWHQREAIASEAPVRWTGPGSEATLDLPLQQGSNYELLATVSQVHDPRVAHSLQLLVNEHPVRTHLREVSPGHFLVAALLPQDVLGLDPDLTRLRFRWTGSSCPQASDPQNPDDRTLGVCFHQLVVAPRIRVAAQ